MATDRDQFPLAGAVLCCTSIPSEIRSSLAATAAQMGASHKFDLTSDVTHLLVGNIDTPKYKYVAKERPDVKCLQLAWVEAVRKAWMSGETMSLAMLEHEYRLPTFYGLQMCITGFEDLKVRKELERTIRNNGAEYSGDLTKDVTHLIACTADGLKYRYAKQWRIHVVAIEWLRHSLERGMALEEVCFDPLIEATQRGHGAWNRRASATTTNSRKRPSEVSARPDAPRKLRRTASAKMDSQNDGTWSDITRHDPDPRRSPSADSINNAAACIVGRASLDEQRQSKPKPDSLTSDARLGIFGGQEFQIQGFQSKQAALLARHISAHGGKILERKHGLESENFATTDSYTIVPHDLRDLPESGNQFVTDFWIEKCLHSKRLVEPTVKPIYKPFNFPIAAFSKLSIASTGFEGIDLRQVAQSVRLLGATYEEALTAQTSVLICNDKLPQLDKIRFARKHGVPTVCANWLWNSIRDRQRTPLDSYLQFGQVPHEDRGESAISRQPSANASHYASAKDGDRHTTAAPNAQPEDIQQKDVPLIPIEHGKAVSEGFASKPGQDSEHDLSIKQSFSNAANNEPLHEISPNSSPPKSVSKTTSSPKQAVIPSGVDNENLHAAIKSLIAEHPSAPVATTSNLLPHSDPANAVTYKGASTISPSKNTLSPSKGIAGRRKRRLFGRASSNPSHSEDGSVAPEGSLTLRRPFSRTHSIDTLNTDGVGSPLDPLTRAATRSPSILSNVSTTTPTKSRTATLSAQALSGAANPLLKSAPTTGTMAGRALSETATAEPALLPAHPFADGDSDDSEGAGEPPPVLTQVGYDEDPEAKAWRTKLLQRVGGMRTGTCTDNTCTEDKVHRESNESAAFDAKALPAADAMTADGRTTVSNQEAGSVSTRRLVPDCNSITAPRLGAEQAGGMQRRSRRTGKA